MVVSLEDVFQKIEENREEIEELGVEELGVFGSVARNQASEGSDIDLLVKFKKEEKTYRNWMALHQLLEQIFETKIDLATEKSLKPAIKERVEKEITYA